MGKVGWLLQSYILETSRWIPTFDSAHPWRLNRELPHYKKSSHRPIIFHSVTLSWHWAVPVECQAMEWQVYILYVVSRKSNSQTHHTRIRRSTDSATAHCLDGEVLWTLPGSLSYKKHPFLFRQLVNTSRAKSPRGCPHGGAGNPG